MLLCPQEFDKEWDAKVAQALKEVRKLTQPNNKKTTTAPASPASAPAPTGAPATATAPSPSPLPPSAPAPPPQPAPAPTPAAAPPSATPPSPAPAPADAAPAPSPRSLADSQQPAAAAAPTASTEAAEKPVADSPAAAPLPAADGKDVASRGATEAAATPAAAPAAAADAGADAILQAAAAAPPAATAEGGGVAAAAAAPAPAPASAAATAAAPAPSATSIAAAAAAAVALLEPSAVPSAPLPAEAAQLGLDASSYDLSAVGLVRHAVSEAGQGVVDWAQWPERYAQAVADSRLVFEALRAVASHHSKELDKVTGLYFVTAMHLSYSYLVKGPGFGKLARHEQACGLRESGEVVEGRGGRADSMGMHGAGRDAGCGRGTQVRLEEGREGRALACAWLVGLASWVRRGHTYASLGSGYLLLLWRAGWWWFWCGATSCAGLLRYHTSPPCACASHEVPCRVVQAAPDPLVSSWPPVSSSPAAGPGTGGGAQAARGAVAGG